MTSARRSSPPFRPDIPDSSIAPPARKRRLLELGLIFAIAALVVAAYAMYWLVAAARLKSFHENFVRTEKAAGVEITQESIRVTGFPYRLTLWVSRPDIRFDTGWRWQAERAIAHISPFDLTRFSLDLSRGTHIVTTRSGEEWRITARRILGRAVVKQGRLIDLGVKAENLSAGHRNGRMRFTSVLAFSAIPPASTGTVRLALRLQGGEVDPGLHRQGWLGARLENAEAAVEFGGGAPADILQSLFSPLRLRDWAEAGGEVQLKDSRLDWGPILLAGHGALQLDSARRPRGTLHIEVSRMGNLTEALIAARIVDSRASEALRLAASLAALNGGRAPLPFRLQEGDMMLGPVRIFALAPLP